MRDLQRHVVAEFVGTFALTFVGGAAIMQAPAQGGLLQVALAHGLVLSIFVTALMRISGHFNPAVTIGFLSVGRIEPMYALWYVIAQLAGACGAAVALQALFPADVAMATHLGGQALASGVSLGAGIGLEIIATFFLVLVIFGTAVDPQAPKVGGFAIGLAVAADILAIGPLTGASMNPARSFGPALVSRFWISHAVYWIGPIIGAVLGAVLYDRLFLRHPVEPTEHGPVRPAA